MVFNSCYMTQAFSLWVQSGAPTTPADAERGQHYPILGHTLGIREPRQQKKNNPKTGFSLPSSVWTSCTNRKKTGCAPPARLPPRSYKTRSNLALNVSLKLRAQIGDAVIKKPFVICSTPAAEVRCTIGIPYLCSPWAIADCAVLQGARVRFLVKREIRDPNKASF